MELTLREMTEAEKVYAYPQSQEITMKCGGIGRLRGDFGTQGSNFYTTWDDYVIRYKTSEFQNEFDEVVNALRSNEFGTKYGGVLKSLSAMSHYCDEHKAGAVIGIYNTQCGFRADTKDYAYLIRCNPVQGDYNFYIYPYQAEWLDRHMENAERGIRFIDSHYNDLFRIKDGESITMTYPSGDKDNEVCRYIDETHLEVGNALYHICEFAEVTERNGITYAPKDGMSNTYEIYQIFNTRDTDYTYRSFEEASGKFNRSDYKRMYSGMLAPNVALMDLWNKHNSDNRPFGQQMRSMSMSDVVILKRDGEDKAFYADRFGFAEVPQFLNETQAQHKPPKKQDRER